MARLALISDTHGNDVALETVLEDIERIGVDEVVCLGDVVLGGPQPRETLERLHGAGIRTALGNSDVVMLEMSPDSPEQLSDYWLEVREWQLGQLEDSHLQLIRDFEPVIELELAGTRLVCFHASPKSCYDLLMPDLEGASLAPFLGVDGADLLAGGHAHVQWTRQIGDATYVNPGSVGLGFGRPGPSQRLDLPPVAEYALVVVDDLGLSIEFRRVPYRFTDVERTTRASGRPHADKWIEQWASW
jgi:predicted phosphodiesterase